ncbi:DUF3810 domain-containing protein [Chryseobacterium sp. BIGb0232]|uniref:DUF3810 domain-containing protein n=1 Tax=Chryseobacterium sp. BIGb0232 TaxID=2940598 RepID=UPI000F486656|nr:DUF3810 domain-containing protein [Chryseobacterium sp. BIGb0232]MCS4305373.1 hypothetical protein [Chryseobacterium sp. BIGb0232]ROS07584.1 uncharacterized protein DUF3810 [Chryseobacterium nakagawai]
MISFFERFFELQKEFHQMAFSWLSFSAGDVIYVLLGIVLLYSLTGLFKKEYRDSSIRRILIIGNLFYFTYQLFWGMLYFQTPIIKKLSRQDTPEIEKAKKLALQYLEKCKLTRASVQEDHNGIFIVSNLKAVQQEILFQQTRLPQYISDKKATQILSVKPSLFKNVMSFTGILGYYNPFTAEAQYNAELPHTFIPFTTAHESSHQLGFAREQEANFIGYLIGIHSGNPDLKYSTEYFTLKSLLRFIVENDPEFVKSVIRNYSSGMKRDRAYERSFIFRHQGWLDDFFGFTNNIFLKSNQQEGSVTYSYFIDLLLNYEK